MHLKSRFNEYTEQEFTELVREIVEAVGSSEHQDKLLEHFISVAEHPSGSDLIYYPDDDANSSPERITEIVKNWRADQGLPGFKR